MTHSIAVRGRIRNTFKISLDRLGSEDVQLSHRNETGEVEMFGLLVVGLLIGYAALTSLALHIAGWFKTEPFESVIVLLFVTNTLTGFTIIFLMAHEVLP